MLPLTVHQRVLSTLSSIELITANYKMLNFRMMVGMLLLSMCAADGAKLDRNSKLEISDVKVNMGNITKYHKQTRAHQKGTLDCGDVWIGDEVSGNCYYFSDSPLSWDDAHTKCQDMHSDLMSVSSEQEQHFIYGFFYNNNRWWVGGNDLATQGEWVWSDGTPFTYTNWHAGEPSNVDEEKCLQMNRWPGTEVWNNYQCEQSLHYICKLMMLSCSSSGNTYMVVPGTNCKKFTESTPGVPTEELECADGLGFDVDVCVCNWLDSFNCPL